MLVSEKMSHAVITALPSCTASSAARLLHVHNIGALPVVDASGTLRGIVTDRDIVTRCVALDSDPANTPLRELMTRRVTTVSPDDTTADAVALMDSHGFARLPVVQSGRIVGMISRSDI